MTKFRVGDRVEMTDDALENYGKQYRDVVFKVIVVSKNQNDHPRYDMGVYPMGLYDLETPEGEYFGLSLYDWELRRS